MRNGGVSTWGVVGSEQQAGCLGSPGTLNPCHHSGRHCATFGSAFAADGVDDDDCGSDDSDGKPIFVVLQWQ